MLMPVVLFSFMALTTCSALISKYVTWYGSGSLLARFYGDAFHSVQLWTDGKVIPSVGLVYAYTQKSINVGFLVG